ncbi:MULTISPECIES: SCO family protein [unclassified Castellaniella]|uniref:SCO family protein n=1 Tax=unclassified Castellaniella TaxID=2617606 RepID=UPI003316497B
MSVLRTCGASVAIIALGVGLLATTTHGFQTYTTESALRLSVGQAPRPVPGVRLQAANHETLGLTDFRGAWLVVGFMYTRCTTVCSVQGSGFALLHTLLQRRIESRQVRLLSISFDPQRDSPEALRHYQQRYGGALDGWFAARPSNATDLQTLLQTFGVQAIPNGLGGYEHNAAFNLVNPQGQLVAILNWDDPQAVARYVQAHVPPVQS